MTVLATSLSDDDVPLADQKNNDLTGGGAPHSERLLKPGYLMIAIFVEEAPKLGLFPFLTETEPEPAFCVRFYRVAKTF
jgi:hypothetical protein